MPECPDCGEEFNTERSLKVHQTVEHTEEKIKELVEEDHGFEGILAKKIKNPKVSFFMGLAIGLVILGAFVSFGSGEENPVPQDIGNKLVNYYRNQGSDSTDYKLKGVEKLGENLYEVNLKIIKNGRVSQKKFYITKEGKYLFKESPEKMKQDLYSLEK